MRFGYLRDRLFVACFSAYWVNRCLESCGWSTPILRAYLNDVICIPFWIPIMVWIHRRLGLRRHDDPPHGIEVVIPLLLWAVVFEVLLPATRIWSGIAVPDPNDVLCYALGALVAVRFWDWWYRRCAPSVGRSPVQTRRGLSPPWALQETNNSPHR
jgi:hypothetical protein